MVLSLQNSEVTVHPEETLSGALPVYLRFCGLKQSQSFSTLFPSGIMFSAIPPFLFLWNRKSAWAQAWPLLSRHISASRLAHTQQPRA